MGNIRFYVLGGNYWKAKYVENEKKILECVEIPEIIKIDIEIYEKKYMNKFKDRKLVWMLSEG